jgi:hypothetical protein
MEAGWVMLVVQIVLLAGKKELVMVPTPQMLLEEPVLCLAALFLEVLRHEVD